MFVNPLLELHELPPGDSISAESLSAFEAARDEALWQMRARLRTPETPAADSRELSDVVLVRR